MAKAQAKFNLDAALKKARANIKKGFERREAGEASGFETFDDGRYIFRLLGIELGTSKNGRFQATFKWKFLGGEYKGKEYLSFQGLVDDSGWLYFLADLARLGFEYESADDITKSALADLNKQIKKDKPVVQATLRTRGEFQNLRLPEDALLDEDELDADDLDEGDDEAEPVKARGKKRAVAEDDEEEESDDESEEDESDDEADEEEADDEEEEAEEEAPKKKTKKPAPKAKKKVVEEDEEADEDDEETDDDESEDEEEDEPIAVSVGASVKVRTKSGIKIGEITAASEDDNSIKVKFPNGKTVKLSAEKIIEVLPEKKKTAKKR